MGAERIATKATDPAVVRDLRIDLKRIRDRHAPGIFWIKEVGDQLIAIGGFRVYIKTDSGANISHSILDFDLQWEFTILETDASFAFDIISAVADFCLQRGEEDGRGFPQRFQGASITLRELRDLARAVNFYGGEQDNQLLVGAVDNLFRFRAVQQALRGRKETVALGDQPLIAVKQDRVELMLAIQRAGYSIEDLEGAVDFWKDGTISPRVENNIVQVADLMTSLREAMT